MDPNSQQLGTFGDSLRDRRAAIEKQLPESEANIMASLRPELGIAPSTRRGFINALNTKSRSAMSSDMSNILSYLQAEELMKPEAAEEDAPSFSEQLKAWEQGMEFKQDPLSGVWDLGPAAGMEGLDPSLIGKAPSYINKARMQLQGAESIVLQLEGMAETIPSGRQIGKFKKWYDEAIGPIGIRNYEKFKEANMGTIARALSGEVGVLNEKDIERAKGFFPDPTDTVEEAKSKLVDLKVLLGERKRILGMPNKQTTSPGGISDINQLGTTMSNIQGQGFGQTKETPAPQSARSRIVDDVISEIYGISQ